MRRSDGGTGCGARGPASQAGTREAPGLRPAGTKTRLQGASAGLGLGEPQPRAIPASPRPRKRGSGSEIAAMERRKARGSRWSRPPETADPRRCAVRRSVPFGLAGGQRKERACPGRHKNRDDGARPPSPRLRRAAFARCGLPAEAPKERRLERWLRGLFDNRRGTYPSPGGGISSHNATASEPPASRDCALSRIGALMAPKPW
jgi:hypothetical protein